MKRTKRWRRDAWKGHGVRVSRHRPKFENVGNTDTRHSDRGADRHYESGQDLTENHMKSKEKREDEVPVVSLYYGHMGETVNTRDEGLPSPVMCFECSQTKALMAAALPRK